MKPFAELTVTIMAWAACIAWVVMLIAGAALLVGVAIQLYWG